MAVSLLPKRGAQVIDDDETPASGECCRSLGPELGDRRRTGMNDPDRDPEVGRDGTDLIERHAVTQDIGLRDDFFGCRCEQVVLREAGERPVIRDDRRRHGERVQNHDKRGDPAIGLRFLGDEFIGKWPISLLCCGVGEERNPVRRAEIDQCRRQGQAVGAGAWGQCKRDRGDHADAAQYPMPTTHNCSHHAPFRPLCPWFGRFLGVCRRLADCAASIRSSPAIPATIVLPNTLEQDA